MDRLLAVRYYISVQNGREKRDAHACATVHSPEHARATATQGYDWTMSHEAAAHERPP